MPTNEKIIAVWGSPHAGKTAFAVEAVQRRTDGILACIIPVILHKVPCR